MILLMKLMNFQRLDLEHYYLQKKFYLNKIYKTSKVKWNKQMMM